MEFWEVCLSAWCPRVIGLALIDVQVALCRNLSLKVIFWRNESRRPIESFFVSIVYGEFRTGKTQLAHTMSVVAQLPPEMGGAAGKVVQFYQFWRCLQPNICQVAYIDTEGEYFKTCHEWLQVHYFSSIGTFRPDRIRSIADKFGVDGSMALENILYGRFFTGLQIFAPSWNLRSTSIQ